MTLLGRVYFNIRKVFNTIYVKIHGDDVIIVNGAFKQFCNHLIKFNYGDDLNFYLIRALSGKRVMCYREYFHKADVPNILAIGSILQSMCNKYSIVWGTGAMHADVNVNIQTPLEIRAVRGPKTYCLLNRKGIKCSKLFGDPALLLPLVYNPHTTKKYKVGIIPHYADEDSRLLLELVSALGDDCRVISMSKYKKFEALIDQICECEYVLSSSLHGIIISDAYSVPNSRIKLSENVQGGDFKYEDYFESVGRTDYEALDVSKGISMSYINKVMEKSQKPDIKINSLIESCPFPIKCLSYEAK